MPLYRKLKWVDINECLSRSNRPINYPRHYEEDGRPTTGVTPSEQRRAERRRKQKYTARPGGAAGALNVEKRKAARTDFEADPESWLKYRLLPYRFKVNDRNANHAASHASGHEDKATGKVVPCRWPAGPCSLAPDELPGVERAELKDKLKWVETGDDSYARSHRAQKKAAADRREARAKAQRLARKRAKAKAKAEAAGEVYVEQKTRETSDAAKEKAAAAAAAAAAAESKQAESKADTAYGNRQFKLQYVLWEMRDMIEGIDFHGRWERFFDDANDVLCQRSKTFCQLNDGHYGACRGGWHGTEVEVAKGHPTVKTRDYWMGVCAVYNGEGVPKANPAKSYLPKTREAAQDVVRRVWDIVVQKEPCPCFCKRARMARLKAAEKAAEKEAARKAADAVDSDE